MRSIARWFTRPALWIAVMLLMLLPGLAAAPARAAALPGLGAVPECPAFLPMRSAVPATELMRVDRTRDGKAAP